MPNDVYVWRNRFENISKLLLCSLLDYSLIQMSVLKYLLSHNHWVQCKMHSMMHFCVSYHGTNFLFLNSCFKFRSQDKIYFDFPTCSLCRKRRSFLELMLRSIDVLSYAPNDLMFSEPCDRAYGLGPELISETSGSKRNLDKFEAESSHPGEVSRFCLPLIGATRTRQTWPWRNCLFVSRRFRILSMIYLQLALHRERTVR